jgi:signal transduction histidine kinase/ActR/RegA family two-component response regulator
MIELGLVAIRAEDDAVRAHQTTRTTVAQLGFSMFEQTRIATAMSEIARNALVYAGGGSVTFGLDDTREALTIIVLDRGPGIRDLDGVLAGEVRSEDAPGLGLGIRGARRLMDSFAIESTPAGTRVEMTKRLPRRAGKVDVAAVGVMRSQLASKLADDPTQEIRRLQRDIFERDARLVALSEELLETNRGVMALHAELEERSEYQRLAVELRTRLVSEMGHELRTPLHSISTISQFLIDRLDGELTEEQDKQVRIIHEVAGTLTAYVNDLLDLARTDAGKASVHVTRFTVDSVLKTLRRIMQPLVPEQVSLGFAIEAGLPELVTDEHKVSQVLRNLLANAFKFTDEGRVEVRATRGTGHRVVFEVADTGVGVAPEHRDLIFREFAQVDGAVQARMRGSGLGLPLSRRLAQLLGGSLAIASTSGAGSTFRFELPAHYGDAEGPAHDGDAPAPVVVAQPTAGRPRILVIDDDLASRYVLRRWLEARYRVEEAETGAEGIRLAATLPDAIFLDVVMPDLTGFEVLERLKADAATQQIPVVVYTALVLGASDRARLATASAILRKSTASRVADRAAIEEALVHAGIAASVEPSHE